MNDRQRDLLADKIVDLGHLVFGALVIGQFVDGLPWKWGLTIAGAAVAGLAYWYAWRITGER